MSQGYLLKRLPRFEEDVEELFLYLAGFDEAVAYKHFQRIEEALLEIVNDAPYRYPYFRETGPPYRARLFRVGKRAFWIIYMIEGNVITMRRIDSPRRPGAHGLGERR